MTCAIYLLHYSRYKRSAKYRFTGGSFILFAGFKLYRLHMLCSVKAQSVLYLTEWTLNEVTFLTCIISVLAINFGFILMVNESLAKC